MKKLFSIFFVLALMWSSDVLAVSWSFSTSEFVNAALAGTDAGCDVRYYQWGRNGSMQNDPCTRIVVCFTSSAGVTYNGVVYPPKGNYNISTTESPWNAGRYYSNNNKWDFKYGSNNTLYYSQMYDNNGTFCKYYTGTFKFDEGDGGICVTSTNLDIAYSDFSGYIYQGASITCGTPATYYNVNVVSNNNSLGTVTSNYKSGYVYANNRSQEYKKNSVYTLTATETDGVFVEWQKNGSRISTSNVVDVTIDGNATYTAVFEAASGGTITVNAGSNGQVKLDNGSWGSTFSNTYSGGQSATIAAQANEGYLFYQWTDNASVTNNTNPYNFTVTSTNTYTASFKRAYTITTGVNDEAFGSVGITEPYSNGKYYEGQSITLTATPANSFTSFVKWQKNGVDYAGGASINVTVNANDTYTAFFSGRNIIEVDIPNATYVDRNATYSLRGNSNGTSSESSGYYVDVQFNASTDALYSVDVIKHNGSNMSFTTKTIEGLEQPCGNRVITHLACYNATGDVYMFKIHWTQPWGEDSNDTYPNDRTINANQQAAYDDDLGAIYVYGYTKEYEWNGQATLRAIGMYFVTGQRCSDDIKIPVGTYEINCSGDPGTVMSYQSGMDKDLSGGWAQTQGVEHGYYLLDKGTVTVTKSGSTYTINVNAKNSYGNDLISTMTIDESVISGTIPNFTLNVTTDGHGTATVKRYDCSGNLNAVSNSGSFKQGSYFQLEASPSSGYAFDYWTIDGVDEHFTNNPEILDGLYDNAVVTAHFKTAVMHTVTISTPTNGTITVMDGETTINNGDQVEEGTVLTVTATPATGYHFDSWTNNGAASVTVNNDVTIGATFAPNTYTVTFAANGGSGTMADQAFTYGTAQNLRANIFTGPAATITYDYNGATGGIGAASETVNATFGGWLDNNSNSYEDEQNVNNLTTTNGATITMTAQWDWLEEITLPSPTKTGYTFNDWNGTFDGMGLTGEAGEAFMVPEGGGTLTAQWNRTEYTITYNGLEGATNAGNPTSYNVETETITLANPGTRDGYIFAGWKDEDDNTITQIAKGSTGDRTLTATWNAKSSDITLCENCNNAHYNTFKANYDGETVNVTYNRRFTQSRWSTMCLPFNLDLAALITNKMYGSVYEFKYATGNANVGSGVNLYFSNAKSIEAGKCYIVNANSALETKSKTPFVFSGVTIDLSKDNGAALDSEDDYDDLPGYKSQGTIELVGTLRNGILMGTATGNKYMGLKENKIYYPNTGTGSTIWAYRGIFRSTETLNVEKMRIVVDGEDKGEIRIDNCELIIDNGSPVRKFIRNGNLYIEREGVIYDAQGKRVE